MSSKQKGERTNSDGSKEVVKIREGLKRRDGEVVDKIDHYLIEPKTNERIHEYWERNISTGEITTGIAATNSDGEKC